MRIKIKNNKTKMAASGMPRDALCEVLSRCDADARRAAAGTCAAWLRATSQIPGATREASALLSRWPGLASLVGGRVASLMARMA